jgi:hypothetical protein
MFNYQSREDCCKTFIIIFKIRRFLNWKVTSTGDFFAEEKYKKIKITFFVSEQYTE